MEHVVVAGSGLPEAVVRDAVDRTYSDRYDRPVHWLDLDGEFLRPPEQASPLGLPQFRTAVADAVGEAHRWGEPYVFFLCPGLIAWVVPLCHGEERRGGALSGEVLLDESDRADTGYFLMGCGLNAKAAQDYIASLPVWSDGRARQASTQLYTLVYRESGWVPSRLLRTQENTAQQRQIAESIHSLKTSRTTGYPVDEERRLFAMIRVGDRKGARKVLNQYLAGLVVHSPALPILRARSVELMGYLVRAAVEDNPLLEPLIEQNQHWIGQLVTAADFDEVCIELRDALDAFIVAVSAQGFNRTNPAVQKALEFVAGHYTDSITLEDVAQASGLSPYRIAHLVKDATGRSVMQHVRVLRVARAQELLTKTHLPGVEIAAEIGYCDQSHFIKEFRAMTGTTPSKYRRGVRGNPTAISAEAPGR